MILRTRWLKTSAPPPGIVSCPAAIVRSSASRWLTRDSFATKSISTAVSAVSAICGTVALSSENSSS
jgi:hypothetical protein